MNSRSNQFIRLLNENLRLLSVISLGVFFFILIFQPFNVDRFDFNDKLLFVAGFGAIALLIMFFVRIIFSLIAKNQSDSPNAAFMNIYLGGFIILALNSVAFAFYLRYVGSAELSFYIVFKIVLISLFPPLALRLSDANKELKEQNVSLMSERKQIRTQIEKIEEDNQNKTIEFISENKTEILTLHVAEIVFIRSADNYVEITYKRDDNFKKSLIRNTLRNIELQVKEYSNFIRCHRICLVNKSISRNSTEIITATG